MSGHRFSTPDWISYLRGEAPAKEARAMKKILSASEKQRAALRGLELAIRDAGLSLDDCLEDIMAALKRLEWRNERRAMDTLERVREEQGLLEDIDQLLLTMESRHIHDETVGAYLSPVEIFQPQSSNPEIRRIEELLVEAIHFIRNEIGQAKTEILREMKTLLDNRSQ